MNKIKLNALRKLSVTKNFVLMTDKESIIFLNIDPDNFDDVQKVAAQVASLEAFRGKLDELIATYDKRLNKVLGLPVEKPAAPSKPVRPARKKGKK